MFSFYIAAGKSAIFHDLREREEEKQVIKYSDGPTTLLYQRTTVPKNWGYKGFDMVVFRDTNYLYILS